MKNLWFVFAVVALVAFAAPAHADTYAPGYDGPMHDDFVPDGRKWGAVGNGTPGGTVTFSFMATGTSTAGEHAGTFTDAGAMHADAKNAIRAAFAAWSAIANIQFLEVADNGLAFNAPGAVGDIRIGAAIFDGPGGVLAHAYFPPVNGVSAAGDMHFDVGDTWKDGGEDGAIVPGAGFDIFQVAAHEIGHAIGLLHTAVPGSLMNPFYTEAFTGLQADDIAGAQFIYGRAQVPPAPEPASLALLGVAVLGLVRRRKSA